MNIEWIPYDIFSRELDMEPLQKSMLRIKAMSKEWIKGKNFQKQ
jgi:hypothetical protein